jgi:plasmid stabilization system protein ParE
MTYLVELTERAGRDLRRIFVRINAGNSRRARDWFNELEAAVFSLCQLPTRGAVTPEDNTLRQLLFGKKRNVYRIIYELDEPRKIVMVQHIRHGAQDAFTSKTDRSSDPR